MTVRRTLSDVCLAQEAMLDRMLEALADVLDKITAPKTTKPAETVKLARGATGDHTTGVSIEVVVQEGETLEQATARAQAMYEQAAARYPLQSGYAHAYPLGGEDDPIGGEPCADAISSRKAPTT